MTSRDFTVWLKGFITACNDYAPTPKQWDTIKEELEKVDESFVASSTTTVNYPPGATWTYTNGENRKQQLND